MLIKLNPDGQSYIDIKKASVFLSGEVKVYDESSLSREVPVHLWKYIEKKKRQTGLEVRSIHLEQNLVYNIIIEWGPRSSEQYV